MLVFAVVCPVFRRLWVLLIVGVLVCGWFFDRAWVSFLVAVKLFLVFVVWQHKTSPAPCFDDAGLRLLVYVFLVANFGDGVTVPGNIVLSSVTNTIEDVGVPVFGFVYSFTGGGADNSLRVFV